MQCLVVDSAVHAMEVVEQIFERRVLREVERRGKRRNIAIIVTLLHTGLRVSELCNLRLADLDMGERHGSLYVHAGKGDRACDIPLNNDVRQALRRWLQVRPVTAHDVVFTGKGGAPLGVDGVEYLCRSTDHRAGARAARRGRSATDV